MSRQSEAPVDHKRQAVPAFSLISLVLTAATILVLVAHTDAAEAAAFAAIFLDVVKQTVKELK